MGEALSPQQSIIPYCMLGEKERDNMSIDYFFSPFLFYLCISRALPQHLTLPLFKKELSK